MKLLTYITPLLLSAAFASTSHAQIFYNGFEQGRFFGSYTTTDEIADDIPFNGTQHVGSFSFEYSNLTSGPVSATAKFYSVGSDGGVGSLIASVPITNLAAGSFQVAAVNLQAAQQFDWVAAPHLRNSSASGGYFSLQFNAPSCGWKESEGPYSLNSFYDLTTGQLIQFQESNASFFLQISNSNKFPSLAVNLVNSTSFGGDFNQGVVTVFPPPTAPLTVQLFSSKPAVASVPKSVTIDAGVSTATFTLTTKAVTADTSVSIAVREGTVTKVANLTVTNH